MIDGPSMRSSTAWRGMTLVEVIVATALLGTLLAGIVLAQARLRHQSAAAGRTLIAARWADALLTAWWPDHIPQDAAGSVSEVLAAHTDSPAQTNSDQLNWRTTVVDAPALKARHIQLVRLDILDAAASSSETDALVSIHLFVPEPTSSVDESNTNEPDETDATP